MNFMFVNATKNFPFLLDLFLNPAKTPQSSRVSRKLNKDRFLCIFPAWKSEVFIFVPNPSLKALFNIIFLRTKSISRALCVCLLLKCMGILGNSRAGHVFVNLPRAGFITTLVTPHNRAFFFISFSIQESIWTCIWKN